MAEVNLRTAIPSFEIPLALSLFRDEKDPRLYITAGLDYLAYDLVYDVYGYSSYEEPLEPCYWYGAASDLARQLAPVVAWPSQCVRRCKWESGGGIATCTLTVFSMGNPWLAPWQSEYTGAPGNVERYSEGWAGEWFYRISRQINGVIEALAFFQATGQAVLPRTATEHARIKYVRSEPTYGYYPRVQDLEPRFQGWVRW